jgi:hypothetical protein
MDGLTLLREARRAGLRVAAQGDRLVVQGPRRLEQVAHALLAEKPQILRALAEEEHEVAWRVDAMRPQMGPDAAIPLLLARPGIRFPLRSCCSCGDPLGPDERYRCPPCVIAATYVIAATKAPEGVQ